MKKNHEQNETLTLKCRLIFKNVMQHKVDFLLGYFLAENVTPKKSFCYNSMYINNNSQLSLTDRSKHEKAFHPFNPLILISPVLHLPLVWG